IRYEFAHRAAALAVTLLTAAVALKIRTRLAWIALVTILAQVAMGGVLVRFLDPKAVAIAHAGIAQLFFGLTVMLCLRQRNSGVAPPPQIPPPAMAATALFAQTILGAAVRHGAVGPVPHIAGALFATALVMWAALPPLITHMDNPAVRRPAMLLLSI